MKFCVKCGKELEDVVKFCPECGASQEPETLKPTVLSTSQETEELVDQSFKKGLASVICASFPIACIVAIVLGSKSLVLLDDAIKLAKEKNVRLSGKKVACKVLGLVGKICGIVLTVIWGIIFTSIFFYLLSEAY